MMDGDAQISILLLFVNTSSCLVYVCVYIKYLTYV